MESNPSELDCSPFGWLIHLLMECKNESHIRGWDMIARFVGNLCGIISIMIALCQPVRAEPPDAARPVRIGLLPTIPTLSLLRLYDPLRLHLQQALGRPVELYTSANFRAHLDDVQTQEFDVLVTAPHFGVIALDEGYVPLVRYKPELRPVIIVPKASIITQGSQLAGKRILTADRLAALSMVAEHWLEEDFGLVAGLGYTLEEASNHSTAIRAVAMGDADAAFGSQSSLRQVPPEIRDAVKTFDCRLSIPHQFTLAHPRLGSDVIAALRTALLVFPDTAGGKTFFATGGFQGYLPLTPATIEAARPVARLVAKTLRSTP